MEIFRSITALVLLVNTTLLLGMASYYAVTAVAQFNIRRRALPLPIVPAIEYAGLGYAILALALRHGNAALVGVLTILLALALQWRWPEPRADRHCERAVYLTAAATLVIAGLFHIAWALHHL